MEPREPGKLVPCEMCGAEAKLICHCRKATLCENCIGKHLIAEPNLGHKPVTFSQNEASSLYEQAFSELRAHEVRLLQEVSTRQEHFKRVKSRLSDEIQKIETFQSTCLEYVTLAVEMTKHTLAKAAESIGKEIVESCGECKRALEEAVKAVENGEEHWMLDAIEKDQEKAVLWSGHVDVKEIPLDDVLKKAVEFKLNLESAEKLANTKPPSKIAYKPEPKTPKVENIKPLPSKSASKLGKHSSHRPTSLKISTEFAQIRSKKECEFPSPEPPSATSRCMTESPSATQFGFRSRVAQLQQTAKNVNDVSDLLKAFHSPTRPSNESFSQLSQRYRTNTPLTELNISSPCDSPAAKTTRHFRGKRLEMGEEQDCLYGLRGSMTAFPEVIPEEIDKQKPRHCLYTITSGSTSIVIRDLETGESTLKTFDGIEIFAKQTFWCLGSTGDVYILGGVMVESQPSTIKKTCLIYSPRHDTMETGPHLTTPRHSCAAVCLKDNLFVTGGVGCDLQAIKDCERLEIRSKKWRRIGNMNIPRESHGVTVHAGRIYVAGTPGEQSIETYNPVNDRWALLHFKVGAGGKACLFSLGEKIAILHEKALTFAWVDKRTAEQVRETEERGWWSGGMPVRYDGHVYLQRGSAVYQFSVESQEIRKVE